MPANTDVRAAMTFRRSCGLKRKSPACDRFPPKYVPTTTLFQIEKHHICYTVTSAPLNSSTEGEHGCFIHKRESPGRSRAGPPKATSRRDRRKVSIAVDEIGNFGSKLCWCSSTNILLQSCQRETRTLRSRLSCRRRLGGH